MTELESNTVAMDNRRVIAEVRRERNQKDLDTWRVSFAKLFDGLQEQIDRDTLDHIDVMRYVPIIESTKGDDEWVGYTPLLGYKAITLHIVSRGEASK